MVVQFGWAPVDNDGHREGEDENPDESAEPSDQLGIEFWEGGSSGRGAEVVANSGKINFFPPPRVCI